MDYYFDEEFNAVHTGKGFTQCLISIGIIAVENDVIIDSFYSLICPRRFQKLMRTVKEMTHLCNADIRNAPSFAQVMEEANAFLANSGKDASSNFYCFGPDDLRTMKNHARYEKYEKELPFDHTIDLQKQISKTITWNQQILSRTLSLDDLKYIHNIQGQVEHNALNDAYDLFYLHQAHIHQTSDINKIEEVWTRIDTKRKEVKQRSQERMIQIIKDRYGSLNHQEEEIHCYPDVVEQLQFLSEHDKTLKLFVTNDALLLQGESFTCKYLKLYLKWNMHEIPFVTITLIEEKRQVTKIIPLTYRNARIFYDIWTMGRH